MGQLLAGLAHAGAADPGDLPAIDAEIFPAYLDGLAAENYLAELPQLVIDGQGPGHSS